MAASGEGWVITDHQVLQGESITLDQDITVKDGGRLTLDGSELSLSREPGEIRLIEVEEGGHLELLNGTWLHGTDRTYSFVVEGTLTVEGEPDALVRIEDVSGSSAGARVGLERAAVDGLLVYGQASMEYFSFRGSKGTIAALSGSSLDLAHCLVSTDGFIGLLASGVDALGIQDCVFESKRTGLFLGESTARIENAVFQAGEAGFGVLMKESDLSMRSVRLVGGNVSLKVKGDSSVDLAQVHLLNYTRVGLTGQLGAKTPVDVTVHNSSFIPQSGRAHSGVFLPRINQGVFTGNAAGYHGDSGFSFGPATDLVLRDNLLYGNGKVGLVLSNVQPDDMEGNRFGGEPIESQPEHELPENGVGRVFEYKDVTFRAIDGSGSTVPGVNLTVTAVAPTGSGNGTGFEKDLGAELTDERGRRVIVDAPWRLTDNSGADIRFTYNVQPAWPGFEDTVLPFQPDDPRDVEILLEAQPLTQTGADASDTAEPAPLSSTPAPAWAAILALLACSLIAQIYRERH